MPPHRLLIAPSNLQFFISDPAAQDVPIRGQAEKWQSIFATREMISVTCLYWNDGDTDLTVGTFAEVDQGMPPKFDKAMPTPSRCVEFTGLALTKDRLIVYLNYPVSTKRTRVRIWTNHDSEPDIVIVAIGD